MALFMDVHSLDEKVSLADVASAHAADLAHQDPYGVRYRGVPGRRLRDGPRS